MVLEPRGLGELDAALELLSAPRAVGPKLSRPESGKGIHLYFDVLETLSELKRTRPPADGALDVLPVHAALRKLAVGHGKLAPGLELLEQGHRLPAGLGGLVGSADEPEQAREGATRVALLERVSSHPATRDRALLSFDGCIELVGEVALVGARFEQVGSLIRGERVGEAQRSGNAASSPPPPGEQRGRARHP